MSDLDEERNQRDDDAQSSNKRPPDAPAEEIDEERRNEDRLGALLPKAGGRPPVEGLWLEGLSKF